MSTCVGARASDFFAFGIADLRSDIVQRVQGFLPSIIDPLFSLVRAIVPSIAGFDVSLVLLWFVIEQPRASAAATSLGTPTHSSQCQRAVQCTAPASPPCREFAHCVSRGAPER